MTRSELVKVQARKAEKRTYEFLFYGSLMAATSVAVLAAWSANTAAKGPDDEE